MSSFRIEAFKETLSRKPLIIERNGETSSEVFGSQVFSQSVMKEFLTDEAYKGIMLAIEKGEKIQRETADLIASAMKQWAISKGATHYTHWFQPLTGATAEKHDAFFDPIEGGRAIDKFEGNQLVQQEPDASSFPSGGIRNTFEARGYTAWDPSSPAFIFGDTLCIPTVFVSYTGEALDNKTPLLKALHAVDEAATSVCQYFDKNVNKVIATLGWEQEYFLVDSALYNARPDLVMCERTLFGHAPAKGQQLDDHYFGSIPERAASFMRELEFQSLKLGIPVKTRHNEVAPNQFECAPIFEEANLAVDHNSLIMDLMDKIARRHNFRVLLHEKPFAGINGSGKHNNWSLCTNTGVNLLSPGKTPKSNLQFLTFFVNTIAAVNQYADLLRSSIASAGNDHRLGANEAPPAIISVFIGKQLTKSLHELEVKVKKGKMTPEDKTDLKLNVVGKIPEILLDNTDRNRTSPFAFTGNKFEFRAVGSTTNCALPMMVLNTIIAEQLNKFKKEVDALINKGNGKDEAIFKVLRSTIISSKAILFEGNNYGDAWVKEAKKRGLNNIKTTPYALKEFKSKKSVDLFTSNNVMSEKEIEARYEVYLEQYQMKIQIESRIIADIARNHIIPTAINYQNKLIENVKGLKELMDTKTYTKLSKEQISMITEISERISTIISDVNEMTNQRRKANKISDVEKIAKAYCNRVLPFFENIRYQTDKLELLINDEDWPLPKFRELLFTK